VGPGKKTYGHPPVMTNPGLTPGHPKAITGRAKALCTTQPTQGGAVNPLFIRRLVPSSGTYIFPEHYIYKTKIDIITTNDLKPGSL